MKRQQQRWPSAMCSALVAASMVVSACGGSSPEQGLRLDHVVVMGTDAEKLAWLTDMNDRVDRLIAQCMHERGFEYQDDLVTVSSVPERLGQVEFVDGDDYGVAARAEAALLATRDWMAANGQLPTRSSYGDSAEREAYYLALIGHSSLDHDDAATPTAGNCFDEAHGEVASFDEIIEPFAAAIAAVEQRVEADQQTIDLNRAWAECMRRNGYDYDHPREPFREFSELVQDATSQGYGFTPDSQTGELQPNSAFAAIVAELDKIQAVERETAGADAQCASGHRTQRLAVWRDALAEAGYAPEIIDALNPAPSPSG